MARTPQIDVRIVLLPFYDATSNGRFTLDFTATAGDGCNQTP